MEFNGDNIEKAVKQFYQDASCQQEINRWLMKAQMSAEAWHYPWYLLSPEKPPEVQFFGASSLHVKISRFWGELNDEQKGILRTQLLEKVVEFVTGPKLVFTRLCIALSSLVLQSTPELWPDALPSLVSTFQQQNLPHLQSSQVCLLLLEILTVLPEELSTAHLLPYRVGVVRNELKKGTDQVLLVLRSVFETESVESVYEQALKCLSSWVQFGIPLPDLEPVTVQVFRALNNDVHFDNAIEALVQLFLHHENDRYPNSIRNLLPYVLSLQQIWTAAVHHQDMEKVQGLTKLIVTVADQNTKLILAHARSRDQHAPHVLALVNMVLQCTGVSGYYPVDECSSDLPFGFWYNLQDEIIGSDREVYLELLPVFTPVYMSLVSVLLQKVQYPPEDEYQTWDSDETDSYSCYRQDIADTLMYSYAFLHHPLLGNFCQLLSQIIERSKTEAVRWQEVEAVLYAVSAVSDSVEADECVYMPTLFTMLGALPLNNHKLVSGALFLIGAYAEWISQHPEVLGSVLPLLLQGLLNSELAQSATLALKDVLRENQAHIKQFVPSILSTSKQALDASNLKSRDVLRLMACLGYVLSVLPLADIMKYLNVLLAPHIQQLQQLSQQQCQARAANKLAVQHKLNMLCWLFGTLNTDWESDEDTDTPSANHAAQPTQLILQELMPVLQHTLATWGSDPGIVECTCDMLKRSVRTLMLQTAPLYAPVSALLQQLYAHAPHPAVLDLAKQLLVLFAQGPEYKEVSKALFGALCAHTLGMFEKGDMRQHPDLLEGFMSFLSQIAKKNNSLLCEDVNFGGVLHAGIVGISMPEAPTVKCSCQFLVEYAALSAQVPAISDTLRNQGQNLVDTLVTAIGGESPRAVIDTMADVLLALNKHQFDGLYQWMNTVVARQGFPNPRVTTQSKEVFARRILKERSNKRRVKDIVQEYTLLWRGLLGTAYAAQTQ